MLDRHMVGAAKCTNLQPATRAWLFMPHIHSPHSSWRRGRNGDSSMGERMANEGMKLTHCDLGTFEKGCYLWCSTPRFGEAIRSYPSR